MPRTLRLPPPETSSSQMQTAYDLLLCSAPHTNKLSVIVYICTKPFHTNNDFHKKNFCCWASLLASFSSSSSSGALFITFEWSVLCWIDKYLFRRLLAVLLPSSIAIFNPSSDRPLPDFLLFFASPTSTDDSTSRSCGDTFCGWFIHGWVFGSLNCAKCNFYHQPLSVSYQTWKIDDESGAGDLIDWVIFAYLKRWIVVQQLISFPWKDSSSNFTDGN